VASGLAALLLTALVTLACAASTGGGGSTTSSPTAATIIERAKSAPLKDATFTMQVQIGSALNRDDGVEVPGVTIQVTTGRLVRAVEAVQLRYNLPDAGDVEVTATPDGLAVTASKGGSALIGAKEMQGVSQILTPDHILAYGGVTNPKLLNQERLGDTLTWHVQGDFTPKDTPSSQGIATPPPSGDFKVDPADSQPGVEEVWLRTDNYYPVQIKVTGPDPKETVTITTNFSAYDMGQTIKLPQVAAAQGVTAMSSLASSASSEASGPLAAHPETSRTTPSIPLVCSPPYTKGEWHWWGGYYHVLVSGCAVNELFASIGAGLTAWFKYCTYAPICIPLAVFAVAYIAWMKAVSVICGGKGASIHLYWYGLAYVHKLC
jgi:outer membrane lipoprotein-sorting protein